MDDDTTQQAMHQLELEHQEWLDELARNEAARREFHDWIASTYDTNRNPICHAQVK